ncbi:MAG: hypothetical protein AAF869_02850 [Pseudomonadota bacterium]
MSSQRGLDRQICAAALAAVLSCLVPSSAGAAERLASPDYLCFNHAVIHTPDWDDRRYRQAVEALGAGRVRIPGGTLADYWDWRRGGVVEEGAWPAAETPPFALEDRRRKGATPEAIAPFFRDTGAGAIFGLNVFSASLADEIAALKRAEAAGLRVDRIQIANEPYFAEPYMLERFPQPEDFAAFAMEALAALREAFPKARIAVPGVVMTAERFEVSRLARWNGAMAEAGLYAAADAVFIHPYIGSNLKAIDAASNALTPAHARQVALWSIPPDDYFLGQAWLTALPPSTAIWITEYNFFEPAGAERVSGAWLQGLVNLSRALRWLGDPRIEHACLHQLIGHHGWQALVSRKGGARSFDEAGRPKEVFDGRPFDLAASGLALAELGAALGEGGRGGGGAPLLVTDHPIVDLGRPLIAKRFFRDRAFAGALVVNLSDAPIDVSAAGEGGAFAEILSAAPWAPAYAPEHVERRAQTVSGRKLIAPPFSIVRVSADVSAR